MTVFRNRHRRYSSITGSFPYNQSCSESRKRNPSTTDIKTNFL